MLYVPKPWTIRWDGQGQLRHPVRFPIPAQAQYENNPPNPEPNALTRAGQEKAV